MIHRQSDKPQEFNSGHITEVMQSCHIIMSIIEDALLEHPAVRRAGMHGVAHSAQDLIMEVYQAVGRLDDE